MESIEERVNKYLQLSNKELDEVLFLLKNKGFLEPGDNSLEQFIKLLEFAYGNGRIDTMKEVTRAIKLNKEIGDE